jgi:hypothetical protein
VETNEQKKATEGAQAEMQKTEEQARSVGGDKTSPTLSGGKATKKAEPVDTISTKTGTKKTSKK